MELQHSLNVLAPVLPGQLGELNSLLAAIATDVENNDILPFRKLAKVHFARLLVLSDSIDLTGRTIPAQLVLATDFDGKLEAHLTELVDVFGAGLDRVFGHCEGYPPRSGRVPQARLAYLKQRLIPTHALYVNTVGRTVRQVADEARLRGEIETFLDASNAVSVLRDPSEIREAIRAFVASQSHLRWALTAPDSTLGARLWRMSQVGLAAVAFVAACVMMVRLPWILVLPAAFLVVLRIHEILNRPDDRIPPDDRLKANERPEDIRLQNQLSAVGYVQRGLFRRILVRAALWLIDFGARNIYYRGHLAGIETIHMARWVIIDNGRRIIFLSNYDGSLESYNNDFVDRVPFGLNLVFSNGQGWPRTALLVFGGASDEQAFKFFLRDHQVPTQVWYVAPAYARVTTLNAAQNTRIRMGLTGRLTRKETREWLRLL
ncbi:MAG: hypothetical protein AUG75_13870 [Cyanobacteria bacterium 13_1_20CM_4_61_6]|nr:MAG: hypothetical protein AUG75_13870 [Cyanobacteria bacterium 13_1_20CM_4_61_6]